MATEGSEGEMNGEGGDGKREGRRWEEGGEEMGRGRRGDGKREEERGRRGRRIGETRVGTGSRNERTGVSDISDRTPPPPVSRTLCHVSR